MTTRFLTCTSVVALLMVAPAVAQENTTDPLLPKKTQSQGTDTDSQQGMDQQQPSDTQATKKKAKTDDQQNAEQNVDEGTGAKKKKAQNSAEGQDQEQSDQNQANDQSKTDGQAGTQKNAQNKKKTDQSDATGSVGKADIPEEKRVVIRQKLVTKNVTRIDRTKIDFDINVGVAVPTTIQLSVLPVDIVEIAPDFEGYQYFVLADGTIIIVEPSSHQIVFVISA